jgi:nicotinamide-nucleotide amidase
MIRAEIITIGNEILAGWTLNSNAHWLAIQLHSTGLPVQWMTTIADQAEEIKRAVGTASERADVIVCTGGLGPTPDDITKKTIAEFFSTELVEDRKTLDHVLKLFESRHMNMPDINRNQALVPASARLMQNSLGTAPGLIFEEDHHIFFFMPGVPREMKKMVKDHVLREIVRFFKLPPIDIYILRTTGIPESRLFEYLEEILKDYEDISVSFLPKLTGVDIKLKIATEPQELHRRALELLSLIKNTVGKYIYTDTESELAEIIGRILLAKNLTLSVAESFTAGLISDWISDVPGCSDYFQGSVIAYSNESKSRELGVSQDTLTRFGAVSERTAEEMALGVQQLFKTDCAIASTGIAGPGGATPEKPVGLCYLAAAYRDKIFVKKFNFSAERRSNKERGAMAALEALRRLILDIR